MTAENKAVAEQIRSYIGSQPPGKRDDMEALHSFIQGLFPGCRLSYLDGTDASGRVVTNPNIGYGTQSLGSANGSNREFYQIGMSANSSGISIYLLGLNDKTLLSRTYGGSIGKAAVTGYCIRFKRLGDINLEVLGTAIRHAWELTRGTGSDGL